jgi:hypothetical protein
MLAMALALLLSGECDGGLYAIAICQEAFAIFVGALLGNALERFG